MSFHILHDFTRERNGTTKKKINKNVFFPAGCGVPADNVCAGGPDPWQLPLPSAAAELESICKSQHWSRSSFPRVFFLEVYETHRDFSEVCKSAKITLNKEVHLLSLAQKKELFYDLFVC